MLFFFCNVFSSLILLIKFVMVLCFLLSRRIRFNVKIFRLGETIL